MWAIVVREARQQFRIERSSTIVIAVVYILLCIVLFFLNYVMVGTRYIGLEEAFESFWLHILALQFFLVHIIGSLKVAASVVRERTSKRLEFETMSGVSEWASVFGRIIGAPLFCYFLVAISVVFALFCHFAGGVDGYSILKSYFLLLTSAFLFYSFAILASITTRNIFSALVTVSLFILIFYLSIFAARTTEIEYLTVFSPLLPFASLLRIAEPSAFPFAGTTLPVWVASSTLYLFLGYWFIVAAARALRLPKSTYLSKPHSLILLVLVQLAVVMAFWHATTATIVVGFGIFIYLAVSFLLLLTLAFILIQPTLPTRDKPSRLFLKGLYLSRAPYFPFFILSVIISLLTLFFGFFKHHKSVLLSIDRSTLLSIVGVFLLLLLFYTLLLKFTTTVMGERGKMVAAFVLLILVVLPPALDVTNHSHGYGLMQVLNPLMLLFYPFQPQTFAVSPPTMLLVAFILYGSLSLVMAVILKMWWGRRIIQT